ncbi:MAG: hypothetical protein H8E38_12205 [SAR324 cluster bacterium]|nr:hypothetical protein [SAR324 cluster bacterium]MBL7035235.1 hypothetical protein [SAR324 cluster bacterium]
MSINIRSNIGPSMRSLGEHGSFRNSMYDHGQEQREKKVVLVQQSLAKGEKQDQLIKNEESRLNTAGLQDEISTVEKDMSLVQTVVGALKDVEDSLFQMLELLVVVANEKAYNTTLREADQLELKHLIDQINKVADETSFEHSLLLDGSHGVRGVATGEHLEFVSMSSNSSTSPLAGYQVLISAVATRSEIRGNRPFTQEIVDNQEQLIFEEGGISNRFLTKKGESVSKTFERLSTWISKRQIPIEILNNADAVLHLRHLQYGSKYGFGVSSFTPGLISKESQKITYARQGIDVQGKIDAIPAVGHGQYLSVPREADNIGGLTIKYVGNSVPSGRVVGTVSVVQNGFKFQIGRPTPHVEQLSISNLHASSLGRDTENVSGFQALQNIDIGTSQKVKDALSVLKKSLKEVTEVKDRVDLFCETIFKSSLQNLQEEYFQKNVLSHTLDNDGNALSFAEQTKNIITADSGRSTMAQANQNPETVLTLLK